MSRKVGREEFYALLLVKIFTRNNMFAQNWGDILTQSLTGVWFGVASFIPKLLVAVILFVIGWILSVLLERIVETVIRHLRVDVALRHAGTEDILKRAGYNLNAGAFIGGLVKWFVIVVFLVASLNVLGLSEVNMFLGRIVEYLPNVMIAVLVLVVAVIIGDAMHRIVLASAKAAHIASASFLAKFTRLAIWIFAIMAALYHLGIADTFVNTLFTGIVIAIAIAVGLAFGLGAKDSAAALVQKITKDLTEHHQ